jgi:MFS-type transporter involved in bile tolerance (Atg22 family)
LGSVVVYRIEPGGGVVSGIVGVIFLGLFLWTAVWVVKQKNQSLLWLFILILPILGVILLLVLDNRQQRKAGDSQSLSKVE